MGRFLLFWGMQPAARIICPLTAGKFHTCGLRSVFSEAHVVRKKRLKFFRAVRGAKLCEAGACFLPVGQKMRHEVPSLFATVGGKCGGVVRPVRRVAANAA